jgi:Tfp pilus assembly protein PilN
MRAVNLLPEKHRPRRPSGGKSGSSYILLGCLGALVLAVLMYVLTANSINSAKTEIADAKAETAQAQAQTQQLGAYGDFAKVKQQRVEAVKSLAHGRTDWERMVRELGHVLPDGVWIQNASASDGSSTSSASAGQDATPSETASTATGPTLTLQGCSRDQAQVAETLVRLRELQGATDVKLNHSTQPLDTSSGSGSSSSSSSGGGDCGVTGKTPNWGFQADVTFDANSVSASDNAGSVPARLGGGQ